LSENNGRDSIITVPRVAQTPLRMSCLILDSEWHNAHTLAEFAVLALHTVPFLILILTDAIVLDVKTKSAPSPEIFPTGTTGP
jgi:cephalosporin hydroxylase